MRELVILGSGPAGLAASMYALRRELDVLVLSRSLGGSSAHIPSFPGHDDFAVIKAREQVEVYRARLEYLKDVHKECEIQHLGPVEGGFEIHSSIGTVQTRAVIVATGVHHRSLGVRGEKEFWGKGLSSNAASYAHLFPGEDVFIHAEGNRGLEAAIELSHHARLTTLALTPDARAGRKALAIFRDRPGTRLIQNAVPTAFLGDTQCRQVVIDAGGRSEEIKATAFFTEFEPLPSLDFMDGLANRDALGMIQVSPHQESSVTGLFAAGDVCSNSWSQVLTSLGSGANAALSAIAWLRTGRA